MLLQNMSTAKAISDDNDNISDAFFDYVLLGSGSADQVAKECKLHML